MSRLRGLEPQLFWSFFVVYVVISVLDYLGSVALVATFGPRAEWNPVALAAMTAHPSWFFLLKLMGLCIVAIVCLFIRRHHWSRSLAFMRWTPWVTIGIGAAMYLYFGVATSIIAAVIWLHSQGMI